VTNTPRFRASVKTRGFRGSWLQPRHKRHKIGAALPAEVQILHFRNSPFRGWLLPAFAAWRGNDVSHYEEVVRGAKVARSWRDDGLRADVDLLIAG
jgi:hypothetical protein